MKKAGDGIQDKGGHSDLFWLGVPDPEITSAASGYDSSLRLLPKEGINRSRAVQLSGTYRIETLPILVETAKKFQLSFQYKVTGPAEDSRLGSIGGQAEIYWRNTGPLNERFNLTYLKSEKSGQPDRAWRTQRIAFTVPAELRSKLKPTAVSVSMTGIGTIVFDDFRLDELEDTPK
jgi:hypothetical protein